ncbi:MAG: 23S rRNA (uracil(1939)-C(5))-methyltransferase RlmD [Planctomycetes bacterium]|nr:23S rRNA (uracil(1939)-C(5))-methyltransferase RlmD [Planctomycetota bacterium]
MTDERPLTCTHFGRCGGCSALDVPIATQLARKQQQVAELLAPFLGDVEVECALPPRTPRHDRTQILYPAENHPTLGIRFGIYRTGSHEIEDIRDCRIQQKPLTVLGVRAGEIARKLRLTAWDGGRGKGLVRAFRARIAPGSKELLLGMVVAKATFTEREQLAQRLWEATADLKDDQGHALRAVGFVLNLNAAAGNALLGSETVPLLGVPWQTDTVAGLRFRVSFTSFYQQNRHADAILFRPALAMLGDVAGLSVVDGYGGVGTFGLRLAKAGAARVTIVENAPSSCADARHNVAENGLGNVTVVEKPFDSAAFATPDLLVVDPPRAGLMPGGVARVLAAAAPRVLLVSCSAQSLARDLAALAPAYAVAAVRLCDLFPHTEHVEVLTLLERRT